MELAKDLVAASAIPILLSILNEGDSYGYSIIKRVKELSGNEMNWTEGMLYPILHRLEAQELIASYWKESDNGRKRKYYKINEAGLLELQTQKNQWTTVHSALTKIWEEK
jgi:DNA-binding PadR family transcriptional regulator